MKSKRIRSRSKVVKNAKAFAEEQIKEEAHHFCRLESALASTEINRWRSDFEFDELREREREREMCLFVFVRELCVNTTRMNERERC